MTTRRLSWACGLLALLTVRRSQRQSRHRLPGRAPPTRTSRPPPGIPMWGYGARHDKPAEGTLDPLMAKAIVISAGDDKVALVGIDIGRGPTEAMMKIIRREIADKAGIQHVLITGSHTHHGPVIELVDEPGLGQGKFPAAIEYSQKLPHLLIEAILAADKARKPARLGVATESVTLNRNRHTKREPRVTDPQLIVMRFDDSGRQADRHPRQLRRAPGDDRNNGPQVLGRLPRFSQEQGRIRALHQMRLHARRCRRHEPQRRLGPARPQGFRRNPGRPRHRAGPVGENRGARRTRA